MNLKCLNLNIHREINAYFCYIFRYSKRSGWGVPLIGLKGGAGGDTSVANGTSGWGPPPSGGAGSSSTSGWGAPPPPNPVASAAWGAPDPSGPVAPGFGAPGMGASGMGAPGMGAPGMRAPGMGAPGPGAPGFGSSLAPGPGQGNKTQLGKSLVYFFVTFLSIFYVCPNQVCSVAYVCSSLCT